MRSRFWNAVPSTSPARESRLVEEPLGRRRPIDAKQTATPLLQDYGTRSPQHSRRSPRAVACLGYGMEKVLTLFGLLALIGISAWLIGTDSPNRPSTVLQAIVGLAIMILPNEELKERFSEEWQSHLNDVSTKAEKLFVALGYVFASIKLDAELLVIDRLRLFAAFLTRLPRYFADEERLRRLKRLHAMFICVSIFLVMIELITFSILDRKFPDRGLYCVLAAVACLWTATNLALIIRHSTMVWPVMVVYITTVFYLAVGMTLMLQFDEGFAYRGLVIAFFWSVVAVTAAGCFHEIRRVDFRADQPLRR